jgi:predicted AlkP superfamily phosphohydrolase/phosphomutase
MTKNMIKKMTGSDKKPARKLVVIGLDGLNPDLVYQWKDKLPQLSKVMGQGVHGVVRSSIPPLSAPAWSCMLSGRNPGHFGFWDCTYRKDYSYRQSERVSSKTRDQKVDTLYKILSEHNKKAAIINVPFTYPPPEIPGGYSISSSTVPGPNAGFTYPPSLKEEVEKMVGEYIIDVSGFDANLRQMDKQAVIKRTYDMDRQRFELIKYFIEEKQCDFVFAVISGTDTLPHSFYHYFDENHRRYTPDPRYKDVVKNHYIFCDENIGKIADLMDEKMAIIVLSGYGVQRLDGRINLNEWLIQEGYLRLKAEPSALTSLMQADIDWSKTKAWATGCAGGIYLNARGREPEGVVDPKDYNRFLDELAEKLKAILDEKGRTLDTEVYKRKDVHSGQYARFGPDLFVSFNNYHMITSGLVGYNSIHSYDMPAGSECGAHGPYGFFVVYDPAIAQKGKMWAVDLLDIAPTVLDLFQLPAPPNMEGKILSKKEKEYSEEEKEVRRRLSRLGYLG